MRTIIVLILISLFYNSSKSQQIDSSEYKSLMEEGRTLSKNSSKLAVAMFSFLKAQVAARESGIVTDQPAKEIERIINNLQDINKRMTKAESELREESDKIEGIKNMYEYIILYHDTLITKVDDDLKNELIPELYNLHNSDTAKENELANSIFLSAEGIDKKSVKTVQAAYYKYPNQFTKRGLENIAKMIIMPEAIYDIGEKFNPKGYNQCATSYDGKYILLSFDPKGASGSILTILNRNDSLKLTNTEFYDTTFIDKLNFAVNNNFIAFSTLQNQVYILDSELKTKKILKIKSKIIDTINVSTYSRYEGSVSKRIIGISFSVISDSNNINSLRLIVNGSTGSVIYIFENINSPSSKPDKIFYLDSKAYFINEDTFSYYYDDYSETGQDNTISGFKLKKTDNEWEILSTEIKKINSFEAQKLNETYAYDVSADNKIRFRENENYDYSYYYYLVNLDSTSKILGTDAQILYKYFSQDNHLFTITNDGMLLDWNFNSKTIINEDILLKNQPPFKFSIKDKYFYKILSLEDLPDSVKNRDFFEELRFVSNYDVEKPDNLQLIRDNVLITENLYNIDSSYDYILAYSYIDLSWNLILNQQYSEAIDIARRSLELDPFNIAINSNIALAYLLNMQIEETKKVYSSYKDSLNLCSVFMADLEKVKTAKIKLNDVQIEYIDDMIDYLKDCLPKYELY